MRNLRGFWRLTGVCGSHMTMAFHSPPEKRSAAMLRMLHRALATWVGRRAHTHTCAMQGIVVESDLTVVWMWGMQCVPRAATRHPRLRPYMPSTVSQVGIGGDLISTLYYHDGLLSNLTPSADLEGKLDIWRNLLITFSMYTSQLTWTLYNTDGQ